MRTRDEIISKLRQASAAGELVKFSVLGAKDIVMGCDDAMLESALKGWEDTSRLKRERTLVSIKKAMKKVIKKMNSGKLTREEQDNFAADCVLWYAYELKYGDAENYRVYDRRLENALKRGAQ